MKRHLKWIAIALILCMVFTVSACGDTADTVTGNVAEGEAGSDATVIEPAKESEMFTNRDAETTYDESDVITLVLQDDGTQSTDERVNVNGNTVTLTGAGTYLVSGTLANGQLIINGGDADKIHLIFRNASIHSDGSAAIYVQNAAKVFLTLEENTVNVLESSGAYTTNETANIDAALYAKKDVTINGSGELTVTSEYGHGLAVKADLVMMDGIFKVTGAKHAISTKNSIRIKNGTYTLSSGTDALHAENTVDASRGFIYIANGTFDINATSDGMDAASTLQIIDGSITVKAGGIGIKATGDLLIAGGTMDISATDDAVHTNSNCSVTDGTLKLSTSDDGIHADANLSVSGGKITITESYEGLEGISVDIIGGTIDITASDDGVNAAGGNDSSGMQPGFPDGRQDTFSADSNCYIQISGGEMHVNASGDGLDSNGSITVTGGVTFVSGSTGGGDAALDYDGTGTITGGVIVLCGNSGMAQNFGSSSTQGSILVNYNSSSTATVTLSDSDGNTIVTCNPPKTYNSVVISAPALTKGNTYSLTACGQTQSITLSFLIYGSGGMGGGTTQPGGRPGGRP